MKTDNHFFSISVSKEVYEKLKYASEITNLTMSTIMRMAIWKEVSKIIEDHKQGKYN